MASSSLVSESKSTASPGSSRRSGEEHEPTGVDPKSHRILLVIRDESLSRDVAAHLSARGHEVTVAETWNSCLAHLRSTAVDLIVLDPDVSWGCDEGIDIEGMHLPSTIVFARPKDVGLERYGIRDAFYFFEPFDATTLATCVLDCLSWRFETCY